LVGPPTNYLAQEILSFVNSSSPSRYVAIKISQPQALAYQYEHQVETKILSCPSTTIGRKPSSTLKFLHGSTLDSNEMYMLFPLWKRLSAVSTRSPFADFPSRRHVSQQSSKHYIGFSVVSLGFYFWLPLVLVVQTISGSQEKKQ
jgi:hypothetical protein